MTKRLGQLGENAVAIFYKEENSIAFVTFDQPDSKVNILSSLVLLALDKILD